MQNSNLKIYARRAALTIEPQLNATGDVATIGIEAARKKDGGNTYDWAHKIAVQVTARELPTVLAVLLGYQDACEFKYHGPGKNKSYTLRQQASGVVVVVSAGQSGAIAVPVEPADVFRLSSLVAQRIQLNQPALSTDALLELLKRSYGKHTDALTGNPVRTHEFARVS